MHLDSQFSVYLLTRGARSPEELRTLILFPPSSKLRKVVPMDSSPLIREIRFCTKYIVSIDSRCPRVSGTAFKRLKDRSRVLPE